MGTPAEGSTKVGEQSWISVGLFVLALGGAVSVTWFLASFKASFEAANTTLSSMDTRLESVEKGVVNLQLITSDRWTGTDEKLYDASLERVLRKYHPDIELPVPSHEQR